MLSAEETTLVEYIDQGYNRLDIAVLMGQTESMTKGTVRRLCTYFDCKMKDLPAKALHADRSEILS